MAGDKRDGDDLFEDLDKFFAPIKDVDWDEPASAGARETPSEEHVSVRADETTAAGVSEPVEATPAAEPDEPEDEDWYDTTVLETIEGIGVDDELADEVVAVGDVSDDTGIERAVDGEATRARSAIRPGSSARPTGPPRKRRPTPGGRSSPRGPTTTASTRKRPSSATTTSTMSAPRPLPSRRSTS